MTTAKRATSILDIGGFGFVLIIFVVILMNYIYRCKGKDYFCKGNERVYYL